jgi:hypothetical protein
MKRIALGLILGRAALATYRANARQLGKAF